MKIEFVDYDGCFPCLCMGTLNLKINNVIYTFSDSAEYFDIDENDELKYHENCFPPFWTSGGCYNTDEDGFMSSIHKPWKTWIKKNHPQWIVDLMPKLINVFNENVPYGCCGGCI